MKKHIRKSSLSSGILLLTVGGIFTAIGVALIVITVKELIESGINAIGAGIITSIVFILAFFGFGITVLVMGGKKIYLRIRQNKTYGQGKDATAKIMDYRSVSYSEGRNTRIRYAFILFYDDGSGNNTFTTDYLYDVNELNYLIGLEKVKIKIHKDFVTICEPFPKDIYKVDSDYGIDLAFYRQKPVKILFCLWTIFFIVALGFLIASFFIGNSTITLAAVLIVFAIHFPFFIPLAIYLIKWFVGK